MTRPKKIFCIVAYDIENDKQRTQTAKLLEKYGTRVNYSVFECLFTDKQFSSVKESIKKKIDSRNDTVIYYTVCIDCYSKIVYEPVRRQSARLVKVV